MIPVLFKEDEQIFSHNGIGALYESLSCDIWETENGSFTMELEYPVDGEWFSELEDYRIIQAKPNDIDEPHNFRIYEIDKSIDELTVYVRANTITNDLGSNLITSYVARDQTPQQAMNGAKAKLIEPTNFDLVSDIQTRSNTEWTRINPLNAIVGTRGSLVDIWGGEIKRTNNAIYLYSRRGKDKVTTIRPGKNIEGLTMTVSTAGIATKVLPTYTYRPTEIPKYQMVTLRDGTIEKRRVHNTGDTRIQEDITVLGDVVTSQYVNNYPMNHWRSVDYNDDEDLRETIDKFINDRLEAAEESSTIIDNSNFPDELKSFVKTELDERAKQYFTHRNPGVDQPTVRINVDMLQLADSPEWEEFKDLERIGLTDTVEVWVEEYDIDVEVRVTELQYDSLGERVKKFTAGSDGAPRQSVQEKQYADLTKSLNDYKTTVENGVNNIMRNTADGLNRKFEGYTEPPAELSSEGDIWFKEIGEGKVEIWIHDGVYWQPLMTEDFGKKIEADMLEQQKDIDAAKEAADEAVEQINTAVVNAGFTSLNETISSVQSISNQAQINSGAAINNALEAMQQASQAIDNTGSLNIRVDEVEGILSVKADKQMVDVLTGVVDVQGLDIQANAQGLALKANQDTVDTLAGTVQSLGTDIGVVAGQVNSRVWNTDIQTAVDGIEIGGRNFVLNSKRDISATHVNILGSNYRPLLEGETYTLSFDVKASTNTTSKHVFLNNSIIINKYISITTEYQRHSVTFKYIKSDYGGSQIYPHIYPSNSTGLSWTKFKIEKGNKATDWTPAPEDTDAKIDHIETEWSQTFDTFSQIVSSIDGRVTTQKQTIDSISSTVSGHGNRISTVEQTASGLQSTVADKASQSQVTQLANGLSSVVKDLDDLEIGGRNLLVESRMSSGWADWFGGISGGDPYRVSEHIILDDGEYIYQMWNDSNDTSWWTATYYNESGGYVGGYIERYLPVGHTKELVTKDKYPSAHSVRITYNYRNGITHKLEKGNKATDWTPAPEDTQSQISQLANNINLRVTKGELLSQINIEAGRTLIQSDRLLLNANNTVITGTAWMDGAVIANASIDGAKIADATIGSAKIASLDVSKISGNTSEFVMTNWNNINDSIAIDGSGITMIGNNVYRRNIFNAEGISLYGDYGAYRKSGAIGYFRTDINIPDKNANVVDVGPNHEHYIGMAANKGYSLMLGFGASSWGDRFYRRSVIVSGDTGTVTMFGSLSMRNLDGISWIGGGSNIHEKDNHLDIRSKGRLRLFNSINSLKAEFGAGLDMYGDINMHNNNIYNNSDVRLKKNITPTGLKSLDGIKQWKFVDYEWRDERLKGTFMGVIAQDTPEIASYNEETGFYAINSSKQLMMTTHAVQQLAIMEENTNKVASQALQLGESNKSEIDELREENRDLRNRIEELESVV